ncbi:hypothetical protein [Thioalkalivibrio sp. ALJT]|nr:hypothetical protein [Thioalkalivibrio sp. ALJT]
MRITFSGLLRSDLDARRCPRALLAGGEHLLRVWREHRGLM